jgi:NAD-dependent SIR2 family protein deacetylase
VRDFTSSRLNFRFDFFQIALLPCSAGTSLQVFSAYRLALAAKKAGARVMAINIGQTRADDILDRKLEVVAGEAISRIAADPRLLLPRLSSSSQGN